MALQFIMALLILKTSWGASVIRWCGNRLEEFVSNGKAGSVFIFGEKYTDHSFAFGVSCVILNIFVLINDLCSYFCNYIFAEIQYVLPSICDTIKHPQFIF